MVLFVSGGSFHAFCPVFIRLELAVKVFRDFAVDGNLLTQAIVSTVQIPKPHSLIF